MAPDTEPAPRVSRAELVALRAASRRRALLGALAVVAGLALLFAGRGAVARFVADAKAADRPRGLGAIAGAEPWALAGVVLGLLAAFGGVLIAVLSAMHARHVARGLAELDARERAP
jgi:hypothetical protein